jgi:hypothetical protein
MEQLDLLTSALENAELARESAEEDVAAMQAMMDKESDIEAQRNEEMKRLTEVRSSSRRGRWLVGLLPNPTLKRYECSGHS